MYAIAHVMEPSGQGLSQVADLCVAFGLSSIVGLERQLRGKSAGLRTQAIVGTAAALVVLISKYGFTDVIVSGRVAVDPSRVAAQIVSGIGFLGAGLIITRRGAVRGLTTAAAVWETAAIGMAAGAGLLVLAVVVTILHFVIVGAYTALVRRLPTGPEATVRRRVVYIDHQGALRALLQVCTERNWRVLSVAVDEHPTLGGVDDLLDRDSGDGLVAVSLTLDGEDLNQSAGALARVPGVLQVDPGEDDETE